MKIDKGIKSFFFVKQGVAKAEVKFQKDAYYPSETAHVFLKLDNSECEKDIERVKIKLKRLVTGKSKGNKTYSDNQILKFIKYPG